MSFMHVCYVLNVLSQVEVVTDKPVTFDEYVKSVSFGFSYHFLIILITQCYHLPCLTLMQSSFESC